jgi:hypothetical protein
MKQLISVLIEIELVIDGKRILEDDSVAARAEVFLESGQQDLLSLTASADHLVTLENQYAISRLGEIRATGEAVVTRASNYEVEALGWAPGRSRPRSSLVGRRPTGTHAEPCH